MAYLWLNVTDCSKVCPHQIIFALSPPLKPPPDPFSAPGFLQLSLHKYPFHFYLYFSGDLSWWRSWESRGGVLQCQWLGFLGWVPVDPGAHNAGPDKTLGSAHRVHGSSLPRSQQSCHLQIEILNVNTQTKWQLLFFLYGTICGVRFGVEAHFPQVEQLLYNNKRRQHSHPHSANNHKPV